MLLYQLFVQYCVCLLAGIYPLHFKELFILGLIKILLYFTPFIFIELYVT